MRGTLPDKQIDTVLENLQDQYKIYLTQVEGSGKSIQGVHNTMLDEKAVASRDVVVILSRL